MENSTKALLIAAAILIVIVIISLGIILIKDSSDTTDQSKQVGTALNTSTNSALSSLSKSLQNLDEDLNADSNKNHTPKKEIAYKGELRIKAGKASPAPPIGPTLSKYGANTMSFVKQFNEQTANQEGIITAIITIYSDGTFIFETKSAE